MREWRRPTTSELCRHVCTLPSRQDARQLTCAKGLDIVQVSWDDCARTKGSVWGPCISDMTLVVEDENNKPHRMPIIRHPNFTDLTWDVPMEKIPLVVGNQTPSLFARSLTSVPLDTFLDNISHYTDLRCRSLHAPRDSHALVSAQACFLPVMEGSKVNFHVELYNYQSRTQDPAVLVIVATSKGSSAQVLNQQSGSGFFNVGGQKLWFNCGGQKCTFTATRLTDDRAERGVPLTGPMTTSEKQNNVIVVVQVPLQQRVQQRRLFCGADVAFGAQKAGPPGSGALFGGPPSGAVFGGPPSGAVFGGPPSGSGGLFGGGPSYPSYGGQFGAAPPTPLQGPPAQQHVDVEPAIVGLGPPQGAFPSLQDQDLKRDERFPVRVTIQWYKSTTNGVVDEQVVDSIARQMEEAKSKADWWGSLVVGDLLNKRPTRQMANPTPPPSVTFPSDSVKHNAFCDKCLDGIVGIRYRCSVCPDFDLCEACEAGGTHGHPPKHLFLKVRQAGVDAYGKNPVLCSTKNQVHSCYCDVCKQQIVGTRFRCTLCPDFDLCAACEATCGHADLEHPMIKIYHDTHVPKQLLIFGAQ